VPRYDSRVKRALAIACVVFQASPSLASNHRTSNAAAFERGLENAPNQGDAPLAHGTPAERLVRAKVPGVSIAVVDGCKIAWAKGYGVLSAGRPERVDSKTRFQAASISKILSAVSVMRQVEQGRVQLDQPINDALKTWKLPTAASGDAAKVTLRGLLSHTSGTSVEGFPGYARNVAIPTTLQVLKGAGPANTPAVVADKVPGAQISYSGGGYVVLQQMLEDVTGQSFPRQLSRDVLRRAGMTASGFDDVRRDAPNVAWGHTEAGLALDGQWHSYPESAAAGLWSTPTDLARFGIDITRAFQGAKGHLLSPAMAREALKAQSGYSRPFGLGFRTANAENGDALFFHPGANEGYRAILVMNAKTCQGVAVMTNGDGGTALWMALLRDLARINDWPFLRTLVG
jgi:CubicO group peptidase (beta-lactamase class C family)